MFLSTPQYQEYAKGKERQHPKVRTITNSFNRMVEQRKDEDAANRRATGIGEEFGDYEKLIDCYIAEMKAEEEKDKAEKLKVTKKNQELAREAEGIRNSALSCPNDAHEEQDEQVEGEDESPRKKRKRAKSRHSSTALRRKRTSNWR